VALPPQTMSAIPCLVLFSPQGPRPLEGLTTSSTLTHRSSMDGSLKGRATLQSRTASANCLTDPNHHGKEGGRVVRGLPLTPQGVRCVYDRDTRSQLLHISPGTDVDFSSLMRLPAFTRGSAGGAGGGHTVLAVQFCVAAATLSAVGRHRTGGSPSPLPVPPVVPLIPPPGSVHIELVVRTTTSTTTTTTSNVSARAGYRLRFTSAVHEVQRHAHHTRIPLQCVRTAQWVQLYIDVDSLLQACVSHRATTASTTTTAFSVCRLQQLRIGAGATGTGIGVSGGGVYVRRVVAGYGVLFPPSPYLEYVVHLPGQHSIAVAPTSEPTARTLPHQWTLPEPLRLPAEAGEMLSLFVRTGEETILREAPVAGAASPSVTRGSEEQPAEAPHRISDTSPHPTAASRKPRRASACSSPSSRAATPTRPGPLSQKTPAQENRAPQSSSVPAAATPPDARSRSHVTPTRVRHREPLPSVTAATSAAPVGDKPKRQHHTALELLRKQQHEQQQQCSSKQESRGRSCPSQSPHDVPTTVTATHASVAAELHGRPSGVPAVSPPSHPSSSSWPNSAPDGVAVQNVSLFTDQHGRHAPPSPPTSRAQQETPALMRSEWRDSEERKTAAVSPPPPPHLPLPNIDDRDVPVESAVPLHDIVDSSVTAAAATPVASVVSRHTSSVASAVLSSSTDSSATSPSLSCTSAAVTLLLEMNERVSRLHAVLAEERRQPVLTLNGMSQLCDNSDVRGSPATSPPPPTPPTPRAAAGEQGADALAIPTAAVERVPAEERPQRLDGVRVIPTLEQAASTPVFGAATPLSSLSAVAGGNQRDKFIVGAVHNTAAGPFKRGVREDGMDTVTITAATPATDVDDTRAVLEWWSSTEVPLQLPDFSAKSSRPTSRQVERCTVVEEDEGDGISDGAGCAVKVACVWGPPKAASVTAAAGQTDHECLYPAADERCGAPLPPLGSTATSWTFHSVSIDPASTFATTTASGAAPLPSSHTPAAATSAAAAGALPRGSAAHHAHEPAVSRRASPCFGGFAAEHSSTTTTAAAARSVSKAVVWRRPATTEPQQRAGGKDRGNEQAACDNVRLGDDTPLIDQPTRSAAAKHVREEAHQQHYFHQQQGRAHQPPAGLPLPPAPSELSADDAGCQTPLTGALSSPFHAVANRPAPNTFPATTTAAAAATLPATAVGSTGYHGAPPPSHHSCSTVSSFHMWLPSPMPVLSTSRVRYPSLTTTSSGGSGGRSATLQRTPGEGGSSAAAGVVVGRAAPPAVRLSATGNAPATRQASSTLPEGGGGSERGPSAVVKALLSASPEITTADAEDRRRVALHDEPSNTPVLRGDSADAAAPADAAVIGDTRQAATRYIYDSVLQCYLDLESNAYVGSST
jgi:hypothetical protein